MSDAFVRDKVVSAEDAVRLIRDRDTVVIGGFAGSGFPEALVLELERRHVETSAPQELEVVFTVAAGDLKGRGMDRIARASLVRRLIGSHYGLAPALQRLAVSGEVEAYNLPLGVMSHLFRDAAAGKPGTVSTVGLDTFVDPRHGGGKVNDATTEDLVEVVQLAGRECLHYRAPDLQVALLRATTADPEGNATMERETLTLETLAIATAVHNARGLVILQVERLAERGTLGSRDVRVPGALVDCVVVTEDPEQHWQTMGSRYRPSFSGELRDPASSVDPLPLDARKVIARRAAMELRPNSIVNLGFGMPEGVAAVASEERLLEFLTLTAEPGVIGGMPVGGLDFGAAVNAQAILDQPSQFDLYDGGGLDCAFLGMAQVGRDGSVNVSRFGPKLAGAGGFINISQNARRLLFLGTFTAGGRATVADGALAVDDERATAKFVEAVQQRTFSGRYAAERGQPVLVVTERCVLRLGPDGLELTELAPGLDLERDVLALMDFEPRVPQDPAPMDPRIFRPEPMGLRDDLLQLPLSARMSYDAQENRFFLNLEGLSLRTDAEVATVHRAVDDYLSELGRQVDAAINYDNFHVAPDASEAWMDAVQQVAQAHYARATRYTTSSFMRLKLGDGLRRREVAPHISERPPA